MVALASLQLDWATRRRHFERLIHRYDSRCDTGAKVMRIALGMQYLRACRMAGAGRITELETRRFHPLATPSSVRDTDRRIEKWLTELADAPQRPLIARLHRLLTRQREVLRGRSTPDL